jgi:hypothetical protein
VTGNKPLTIMLVLWGGVVLGVSFIATPAKFLAPHLTMPVALEVGRATFHIFNKVEWLICTSILAFTLFSKGNLFRWVFIGGLVVLLLLKTFYLLPALNMRTDRVIAGGLAKPGILHWLYISADLLQLTFALVGAWWLMKQEK